MKLKFDSKQDYQLEAIQSVIDIFKGQKLNKSNFEVSLETENLSLAFSKKGISNQLLISEKQLLINIKKIQKKNKIELSSKIEKCSYQNSRKKTISFANNFTIEMETGTGKTYTYLRTIYELNKIYGFQKFVIVVPSVAIREGTIKNLEITQTHFQNLYGNPSLTFKMYQSGKLGQLRSFSTANSIQILVLNIDSFTKDSNIINTLQESGIKPIEYIQSTNPIVLVDEPQNMETDIRKNAIHNLNPVCSLRYSATHRNFYNLIYSLNPVEAYDLGLVKQIEVDGITSDENYNSAFIHFKNIQQTKSNIKVNLTIYVNDKTGIKPKAVKLGVGDNLYDVSNNREIYKNGFVLNSVNSKTNLIEFSNGLRLEKGKKTGGLSDEIMKFQIERTIKTHFEKEKVLKEKGIKVLSLFFIDKVSNYRFYDKNGKAKKGKFALWFEELFKKYAPQNYPYSFKEVHNGYFSQDKKGKIKDTKGDTLADNDTYSLIMKEKERLLSLEEPLRFIFSHTALREGWDNPNVFQICTLNESRSDLRKRQEIGRGLRLPVNNLGERVFDKNINILTIIANESYIDFSTQLQNEITSETSVNFKGRIKNANKKEKPKASNELTAENFPVFFEIWSNLNTKTNYRLKYNSSDLVKNAIIEVKKMPKTSSSILLSEKQKLKITNSGIETKALRSEKKKAELKNYSIPDIYAYIQAHIELNRESIFEILKQSGRYKELLINPQLFLDNFILATKTALNKFLEKGIEYNKINEVEYSMQLANCKEIKEYSLEIEKFKKEGIKFSNYLPFEKEKGVKSFFKLAKDFKIKTPLGNFNPLWAVVFQNNEKIYFIN